MWLENPENIHEHSHVSNVAHGEPETGSKTEKYKGNHHNGISVEAGKHSRRHYLSILSLQTGRKVEGAQLSWLWPDHHSKQ